MQLEAGSSRPVTCHMGDKGLGTQRTIIGDRGKEGTRYLRLFLIPGHSVLHSFDLLENSRGVFLLTYMYQGFFSLQLPEERDFCVFS